MKHASRRTRRPWRPGALTWLIAVLVIGGVGAFLYPKASAWIAQYNQSKVIETYTRDLSAVEPAASEQLAKAGEYNRLLSSGVVLEANANKPTGAGENSPELEYNSLLRVDDSGMMARLRIAAIGVDIPVYHGTSDDTLLRGAGHLEGSSLPVGGVGTHAVITAHRGLASATMFSNLDKVQPEDTFVIEVFDQVLTYQVRSSNVVEPSDTRILREQPDKDLVTLVTCTPLGINSHRILVTAERVTPTPLVDITAAGAASGVPGFPMWLVVGTSTVIGTGIFLWRAGFADARVRARRTIAV